MLLFLLFMKDILWILTQISDGFVNSTAVIKCVNVNFELDLFYIQKKIIKNK